MSTFQINDNDINVINNLVDSYKYVVSIKVIGLKNGDYVYFKLNDELTVSIMIVKDDYEIIKDCKKSNILKRLYNHDGASYEVVLSNDENLYNNNENNNVICVPSNVFEDTEKKLYCDINMMKINNFFTLGIPKDDFIILTSSEDYNKYNLTHLFSIDATYSI